MSKDNYAASGGRKEATARATLIPGSGNIVVNGKPIADYFCRETLVNHARKALVVTETESRFDVVCSTKGGGITGQAGAIRLAVARALLVFNPEFRSTLRSDGLLTRDAREVERKKYGQPKARKRFQYSKR